MKKIFIMAVLALLVAVPAMAAVSVVNSKHDMISSGFAAADVGGTSTEICIFCHTPHGAQTSVTQAPLWNNTASANILGGGIYNSYPMINGVSTKSFAVSEVGVNATDARLCLACHDGNVGMPVNQPNDGDMVLTALAMDANTIISTNLSNDHPIGMNLTGNPEGFDPGIRTILEISDATRFDGNPFYNGTANTMWCSTCHDVHDSDPLKAPFLRMNNAGSAMCKACHKK